MVWHDNRCLHPYYGKPFRKILHLLRRNPACREEADFGGGKPPPYDLTQDGGAVPGADGQKIHAVPAVIIVPQAGVLPFWLRHLYLICSSFSTSFRLMVSRRLIPCSFVGAKSALLGTPAGGNPSPAPLRLLSPPDPLRWARAGAPCRSREHVT